VAVTNLQEFTVGVRRRVQETRTQHENRTKAGALYALQNLVFGTRVDTGRARGNWQVAEGEPPVGYDSERYDLAGRFGNRDAFAEETQNVLGASGRNVIWIHNGVPYIGILEGMDHMLVTAVESLKTWLRTTAISPTNPSNPGGAP
jgi:hypothetical protein